MINNEMNPTMASNLYSLGTHHLQATGETNLSTVGQVQVATENAVLPLENEKGTQMDVTA